jgi:hypothetical protein
VDGEYIAYVTSSKTKLNYECSHFLFTVCWYKIVVCILFSALAHAICVLEESGTYAYIPQERGTFITSRRISYVVSYHHLFVCVLKTTGGYFSLCRIVCVI